MGVGRGIIFTPPASPPPYFLLSFTPLVQFLSLPSLPIPLRSKMTAIIFAKKVLSTRLPKLCLLVMQRIKLCNQMRLPGSSNLLYRYKLSTYLSEFIKFTSHRDILSSIKCHNFSCHPTGVVTNKVHC